MLMADSTPLAPKSATVTNRLISETSPYLRQHVDNPVDWFAWGPEAFAEAVQRDVPILLSVGYSACHWCHVMAHESFEDPAVAKEMNERFVCVKVDREERPDVDAVYMDAVQAISGRGGWPMTVFLTPAGEPFYGGTYFPRAGFLKLMEAITDIWNTRRHEVTDNVAALVEAIGRTAMVSPAPGLPNFEFLNQSIDRITEAFDEEWGGFGSAPKFPSTMNLDLIARRYLRNPNANDEMVLRTSLDAMCSGGMYDHLGGGFARYSVDAQWLVPHFEKMLYDQALLLRVYTHAWQLLASPIWKTVVEQTVEYLDRDLRHPEGGFYSAEDADSLTPDGHSEEGAFYTWTVEEIRAILPPDQADEFCEWFDITVGGNFEGRNIPTRHLNRGALERTSSLEESCRLVLAERAKRSRPGLDSKIILEWNALLITALTEAGRAFQRPEWTLLAVTCADFLYDKLRADDGSWHRTWQAEGQPQARHQAVAADYANLIDAFTRLAETTGTALWIERATEVADYFITHFHDEERSGFFNVSRSAEQLVVRQKDLMDNATPAANSSAALALLRLGTLLDRSDFIAIAGDTLRLLTRIMEAAPSAAGQSLAVLDLVLEGTTEIVLVGDLPELERVVDTHWLPSAVIARGEPYASPLWEHRTSGWVYVCRNYSCAAPTNDSSILTSLLH